MNVSLEHINAVREWVRLQERGFCTQASASTPTQLLPSPPYLLSNSESAWLPSMTSLTLAVGLGPAFIKPSLLSPLRPLPQLQAFG